MTSFDSAASGDLLEEARALLGNEPDLIANAANLAALIYCRMPRLNWAGFYFWRGDALVLGPFQGLPACTRIASGRGVCGTAYASGKSIRVDDVHEFPGHIACDAASLSELVVPFNVPGVISGVIDLDSPERARFTAGDQALIESLAQIFCERASAAA